jgi:hypothetical protein
MMTYLSSKGNIYCNKVKERTTRHEYWMQEVPIAGAPVELSNDKNHGTCRRQKDNRPVTA